MPTKQPTGPREKARSQPEDLIYADRETGLPLESSRLPIGEQGIPDFLSDAYVEANKESWDAVYASRPDYRAPSGEQVQPAPVFPNTSALVPYFRQVHEAASRLGRGANSLEIGCGTAQISRMLFGSFDFNVYGIDISPYIAAYASREFEKCGLDGRRIGLANAAKLPFADGTFDFICGQTVFEHFDDPDIVAQELFRVMRPGGSLILDVPNARRAYGSKVSERVLRHTHTTNLYTIEQFKQFFEDQGFQVVHTWGSRLIYTTPFLLMQNLKDKLRPGGGGGQTGEQSNSIARKKESLSNIKLLAFLDRIFKSVRDWVDKLAYERGWLNDRNGVIIGVICRKPDRPGGQEKADGSPQA